MAMASFIGKLALVPKCNQPNRETKHHTHTHIHTHNSSIRVLITSSPAAAAVETVHKISKYNIGKGRLWEISASENMATETSSEVVEEKLGVKIQRNPPESKLAQLGVRNWSKWGCPPSKFPWTYSSKETCYLLKGKVKVYPDGSDEAVEFGAGDLVVFPNGMSCTWDVSETVDKHYKFE